jgi:hypothetical protein
MYCLYFDQIVLDISSSLHRPHKNKGIMTLDLVVVFFLKRKPVRPVARIETEISEL